MVVDSVRGQLEPFSQRKWKYLRGKRMEDVEQTLQCEVEIVVKHVLLLDEKRFGRTSLCSRTLVSLGRRAAIQTAFHDKIGH